MRDSLLYVCRAGYPRDNSGTSSFRRRLKIGRTLRDRAVRVEEALRILRIELGREPDIDEIAGKTGLGNEEIVEAQDVLKPIVSLSEPGSSDDSFCIEDRIASLSFADDQ